MGSPAAADEAEPFRLRPELWNFYQWNEGETAKNSLTFRIYQDVDLGSNWSVTFREELPIILTDKTGPQNVDGEWSSRLGDSFLQAVVSTPEVLPDTRLEVGLRAVFPTGGESPFGGSTYQLGPMVGISHRIDGVAGGLLLHPYARYLISVAETEEDATPVREVQIYPHVGLAFAENWRVDLWEDEPIVFDHETGEWFVPFDARLSYRVLPGATLRFGGAVHLTQNTTQYTHMVYGALAFSF